MNVEVVNLGLINKHIAIFYTVKKRAAYIKMHKTKQYYAVK